ncbi:MAG: HD domain-containing protein [Chloroflexi bacterium]|nr:HD domain-containing protein [Chloroflexota bacterium]
MRLVPLDEVEPGRPLGQALYNERGDVLAQRGVVIDAPLLAAIKARGYSALFVDDAQTEGIEIADPLSPETRARATRATRDTIAVGEQAVQQLGPDIVRRASQLPRSNELQRLIGQSVPVDGVFASAQSIVEEVLDAPTVLGLNAIKSQDSFAFAHAIEVASVAVMVGRKLGLKPPDLKRLGRGALLHDIGQVFTGDTVDGKTEAPTPADIEQVKRHTRLGYDFLQNVPDFDILMNHIAYQHHEWHNGKGYPRGLVGADRVDRHASAPSGQILLIAQLTSIADIYDALCSDRPFRARLPRELAMSLIRRMAGVTLHAELLQLFFEIVPVFPTGYPIRVFGGALSAWKGVVARLGSPDINRPVVRLFTKPDGTEVEPFDVDLATDTTARLMTAPARPPRPT